jgi:hypothetical protein
MVMLDADEKPAESEKRTGRHQPFALLRRGKQTRSHLSAGLSPCLGPTGRR